MVGANGGSDATIWRNVRRSPASYTLLGRVKLHVPRGWGFNVYLFFAKVLCF